LLDWSQRTQPTRAQRARLRCRFAVGATGLALVGLTIVAPPHPRLLWNASASAPLGLYAVTPGAPIARGDMIVAWAPREARSLAARRLYLPLNVPLVKRVVATNGDRVCAVGRAITINGRRAAVRLRKDEAGRPMPSWHGCVTLGSRDLFLLMPAPTSFDGRYFGPIKAGSVIGKARPLWLR